MVTIEAIRHLDTAFAAWLADGFVEDQAGRRPARRLAAAVSLALHLKHTCLDLDCFAALGQPALDELLDGLGPAAVRALPAAACAVAGAAVGNGASRYAAPLVRSNDGRRLWLQKYYLFERRVAGRVRSLAAQAVGVSDAVADALDALYPAAAPGGAGSGVAATDPDQRAAVRTALSRRLAVVTGGPGTGKTWTVARIIALLLAGEPTLRVELAAPTGKAANRMMESLHGALENDAVLAELLGETSLPPKARTLHSLLGIYRHSPKARFDAHRPLPLDVLIVDEASMVDLPMMARLLDALPDGGRLVLLGDRDQLASVEAGGVLAELCRSGADSVYGAGGADAGDGGTGENAVAPVATLRTNHRSIRAIHDLAMAVNAGELPDGRQLNNEVVRRVTTAPDAAEPGWLAEATHHFETLTDEIAANPHGAEQPPAGVLSRQSAFQLLCALRAGPAGVAGVNARMERRFGRRHEQATGQRAHREGQAWFPGLPVMITANDHDRKLYNGDVGLVLPVDGELRACFPGAATRAIRYAQMPPFETAYAMTVHKAQGSEYDTVLLVLPDDVEHAAQNPVITRELLYTAITRAANRLEIHCGEGVLEAAIARRTVRMSGLGSG